MHEITAALILRSINAAVMKFKIHQFCKRFCVSQKYFPGISMKICFKNILLTIAELLTIATLTSGFYSVLRQAKPQHLNKD